MNRYCVYCKAETTLFTTDDGEYYYPLCTECG